MDPQAVHRLRQRARSGVAILLFCPSRIKNCMHVSPCRSSRHKRAVPSAVGNRMSKSSSCSELFVSISAMMPLFAAQHPLELQEEGLQGRICPDAALTSAMMALHLPSCSRMPFFAATSPEWSGGGTIGACPSHAAACRHGVAGSMAEVRDYGTEVAKVGGRKAPMMPSVQLRGAMKHASRTWQGTFRNGSSCQAADGTAAATCIYIGCFLDRLAA